MNQFYAIIILLLQYSEIQIVSDDDIICLKQNNSQTVKIDCTKDNISIFSIEKPFLISKIVVVGNKQVCWNDQLTQQIECYFFDGGSIGYSIKENHHPFKKSYFLHLEVEENYMCSFNDQQLKCWGSGPVVDSFPTIFLRNQIVKAVHLIKDNACVIQQGQNPKSKQKIFCWGDPSTGINEVPIDSQQIDFYNSAVITGYDTLCVIHKKITPYTYTCWGKCLNGICEIPIEYLNIYQQIALGQEHGCSIQQLQNFYPTYQKTRLNCWGSNSHGQTSIPSKFHYNLKSVAVGIRTSCGIRFNQELECWGAVGQDRFMYMEQRMLSIVAGGRHSCSARKGFQECWGNDEQGQLQMDASFETSWYISAGWDFTCQLNEKIEQLQCKGFNQLGQTDVRVMQGDSNASEEPGALANQKILKMESGLDHTCAVLKEQGASGKVDCWGGRNEQGQLLGELQSHQLDIIDVTVGHDFSCVVAKSHLSEENDFPIKCVGNNDFGQLLQLHPITKSVLQIAAGGAHGCLSFLKERKQHVQCWGSDMNGQLQVPNVVELGLELAAGDAHSCVLTLKDGGVVCWGSIVVYESDLHASQLTTDQEHWCLLKKGSKGYCRGGNEWGQCDVPNLPQLYSN